MHKRIYSTFLFFTAICFPLFSFGQVVANFGANQTSGCSPVIVQFNDLSSGGVTAWSWNLGNGNTSTAQNPSAIYVTPGTYTVSLTVSGGGSSNTVTRTAYITVFQNPTANLVNTSPTTGCQPWTVCFSDISTPGSGTITNWLYDFGDGNISYNQNPCHTYNTPGDYTVSMVVTDNNGCNNTVVKNNYVHVKALPSPSFAAVPQVGCFAPLNVQFNDLTYSGLAPYTYLWDFGDGTTSTLASPSHTYNSTGFFTVTLTVTDANGCQNVLVRNNYINIGDVTAAFLPNIAGLCEGQSVSFTDNSFALPTSWNWDFGDGGTSILQNPTHVYNTAGVYDVTLIVSNGACFDTMTQAALINVVPAPVANFVADTTRSCELPFVVNFSDLSSGNPTNWFWDFGDGSTSTLQNPTHTYTAAGSDTVTLIVIGPYGCVDTLVNNNYIEIIEPEVSFTASPIGGCIPLPVQFTDFSFSMQNIVSWQWDFGDGGTSTLQNPTHTYTTVGVFTVSLIITNAWGCTDTLVIPNYTMAGTPPTACFTSTPPIQCGGAPVNFTNCSSNATNYVWAFGDGGGALAVNPAYIYLDTGCFTVSLRALNYGCPDDTAITDVVCILPPVARFFQSATQGCGIPYTLQLTDNSIDPDTWFWDFGDGTTSTQQSPSHTYTSVGTYTITLTTTNFTSGCTHSTSRQIRITDPQANYSAVPTVGCAPMNVNFTNLSTPAIKWWWNFGDGSPVDTLNWNPNHTYVNSGLYSPILTILDDNNCTSTISLPQYLTVNGPNTNFVANTTQGCFSMLVQFTDLTTSMANLTSWFWTFGDGTTSTLQNPSHVYAPGIWSVSLRVVDATGCQRTFSRPFYIVVSNPQANFTVSDSMTCKGMPLQFINSSVGGGLTYSWNFGDGTTSTLMNPGHTYTANGTYSVYLAIRDVNGCRDTLFAPNLITIQDVLAGFTASPTVVSCPPALVGFIDGSSYDIVNWSWDFGDGGTSAVTSPVHLYTTAGIFDVSLAVENNDGCRDTLIMPGLVNILGPTGTFTFDPDTGCTPQLVNFAATTSNTVSYTWDFGDGTVVTTPTDSTTHVYTLPGVYFPVLILDNGFGCQFSVISQDSIVIDTLPTPAFSMTSTVICGLDSAYFFDQTVSNRPIVAWYWDFGDGTTSTLQNPVHLYPGVGTYTVTMAVTSSFGCTDTLVFPAIVSVYDRPTAGIIPSDTLSCDPFFVSFLDASTGPQAITAWLWDFDNGNTSPLQNPNNTFIGANTYQVSLIAIDNVGCRDTAYQEIVVNPGPSAMFSANDSLGCVPFPVTFTANTGMGIVAYAWDFGNGVGASGNPVNHTYTSPGNYTITLIVTDTLGCADTLVRPQYIRINPPTADFAANVTAGCATLNVTFSDLSNSIYPIQSYEWDFGDGTTGLGAPVNHAYPNPGVYTVSLIITDSIGCKDTIVKPNYIEVFERPTALWGVTDTLNCRPFTVQFTDSSSGPYPIAGWNWNFGDGGTALTQNPAHGYVAPGTYLVTLIVTDINGCTDTLAMPYVVPVLGLANFVADNPAGCKPLSVNFTADSLNIISYEWDFGDGQSSNLGPQVGHFYPNYGYYDVTLIVHDVFGCSDTMVRPNYVFVDSVDANFSVVSGLGCAPFPAVFVDLSFSDTTLVSWQWDFGDGGTSTLQNPTHVYTAPGSYSITLVVTSVLGCTDSITLPAVTIFTNDPPPVTPILMVTVESNSSDSIAWIASEAPDFDHYVIYWEQPLGSGNWVPLDSLYNVNDTSYTHNGLNTLDNSYCYRLQVVDLCGFRSDFDSARVHCTIDLEASPVVDQVVLNWNPYIGWDAVLAYDVFRVSSYNMNTAVLIGTVNGSTTTYVDPNVECYNDYCYRVQARELGGFGETSRSDTSCSMPIHIPFPIPMEICAATVVNDSFVEISWSLPLAPDALQLKLEKSLDNQNWNNLTILPVNVGSYNDFNVNVHDRSYYYRIAVVDSCGDLGPYSNIGRTILLNARLELGTPALNWNQYEDWAAGILDYSIEILNDATQTWQPLATLDSGILNYIDEISNFNQVEYCYRVLARENGGTCRSLSNVDCVPVGPNLFIPNAFTPNGDGLNDLFEIKGIYISDFHLRIYDRWGMLIFESFSLDNSWNGDFQNMASQEGAYAWVVDAVGYDGQKFDRRGTCTLLR